MSFPHDADLGVTVRVYLGANPNDLPSSWPAPVEFTTADRLLRRPIQIRRGRGNNQKTAQAGSCTFWLDNTDGALTPLLPTSTYYPDWDLGVPCDLSVSGVGNAPPYMRHAGFVADVKAVMVPGVGGQNISAVQVTSAGVLRRLSQGAVAKSPLFRTITGENAVVTPVAYWPMESEGTLASILSSWVSPSMDAVIGSSISVLPGGMEGPPGSAGALALQTDIDTQTADFNLRVDTYTSTGTTVVTFNVRQSLDDAPDATVQILGVVGWDVSGTLDTGSISNADCLVQWIGGGAGFFTREVSFSANAGSSFIMTAPVDIVEDGAWHEIQVRATQVGADIAYELWVDGTRHSTATVSTKTHGLVLKFRQLGGVALDVSAGLVAGRVRMGLCHLSVYTNATTGRFYNVMLGYPGERAYDRINRTCAEEGIPFSGTPATSNQCGPQPLTDVVAVLQDAEAVDHGMLIEDFAFGLAYRCSSQRYNLEPVITVDLATYRTTSGTQGDVLAPVRNDARTRNEWTISRPNGGTNIANDAAHIAKRGRFNDSATVGVQNDNRILDEATWRVHEGTFDGLRYDNVPLDLAANL